MRLAQRLGKIHPQGRKVSIEGRPAGRKELLRTGRAAVRDISHDLTIHTVSLGHFQRAKQGRS